MIRYAPRIFRKSGLPIHVIYHCTYRCNSRCKSCFLWKEIEEKDVGRELNIQELKKMRETLKDILWLQIGGGEPFLREDLVKVCEVFRDVDTIAIPTNCILPELIEQKTKEILRSIPSRLFLVLSMDGLEEVHDRVRGVAGNFKSVLETYKRVDKLRYDYPNFKIGINTVITEENQDEIIKVVDYVRRFFKVDMHAFEFLRGKPREISLTMPNTSKCGELVGLIKRCVYFYKYGGGLRGKILKKAKLYEQDLILRTIERKRKQIDCLAGQLSGVISPYGDVCACELINERLGNLRDFNYDFDRIWSSPDACEIRKKIRTCFCTHSCFYLINSLFNPCVLTRAMLR